MLSGSRTVGDVNNRPRRAARLDPWSMRRLRCEGRSNSRLDRERGATTPEHRRRGRIYFRIGTSTLAVGSLVTYAWIERSTVSQSVVVVGRARWDWLLAAAALELVSMIAFSRTQRVVLRAAGVRISIPAMAATALAGNAISSSLPVVGPGAGSIFTYGRFRQLANDPAPVGWTLLVSGLISNFVWILLIAIGAAVSNNLATAYGGMLGGIGIVLAALVVVVALRRPRSRDLIARMVSRLIRVSQSVSRHPVGNPVEVAQHVLDAPLAFRMRHRDWAQTLGLSFFNWFASVGCLVAAILAVGARVPWASVILIYCAGASASAFNITPGGLGVTEAVLAAGLVAANMRPSDALGSVLIFRVLSFWLVTIVGLGIYASLRRGVAAREADAGAPER